MARIRLSVRSVVMLLAVVSGAGPAPDLLAACTAGNPNSQIRESTPTSDLTINGNGTVTHSKTGLTWKQCVEGLSGTSCATGTATSMTWANALNAANAANALNGGLGFAGHNDWRVPNLKELQSIVEYCGHSPSINQAVFPATPVNVFWSSTSYATDPAKAWAIGFSVGYTGAMPLKTGVNLVRLVRGGSGGAFDRFPATYGVTYDGNGATGGTVPVDPSSYAPGATVTVLGNSGGLVRTGYDFSGWNTASNGSGTSYAAGATFVIPAANVTLYAKWTVSTYTIGGTVSGLGSGKSLVLQDNGADNLTVSANGSFTFATPISHGGSYGVTVLTQPVGQTCSVASGSGSGVTANVTNVSVNCTTSTYTIGGTVSGLGSGKSLVLQDNGGDNLTVSANGGFTFATPVAYGGSYAVTVLTQPVGQTCSVTSGSGSNVMANVTTVSVSCTTITYTVTYDGNGATGGSVPVDGAAYANGDAVTVLGNTGGLTRIGHVFAGWNTQADGAGTSYGVGDGFAIGPSNVTLYAKWIAIRRSTINTR